MRIVKNVTQNIIYMIPNKLRTQILKAIKELYYQYDNKTHTTWDCPLCNVTYSICDSCPNIVFHTRNMVGCVVRKCLYVSFFRRFNEDSELHSKFWKRTYTYLSHVPAKYWYNKTVALHIREIASEVYRCKRKQLSNIN